MSDTDLDAINAILDAGLPDAASYLVNVSPAFQRDLLKQAFAKVTTASGANALASPMQSNIATLQSSVAVKADADAVSTALMQYTKLYKLGSLLNNAKVAVFVGTVSSGICTVWATSNGASTGTAIFTSIDQVVPVAAAGADTPLSFGAPSISVDKKSVTFTAKKTAAVTVVGISVLAAPVNMTDGSTVPVIVMGS